MRSAWVSVVAMVMTGAMGAAAADEPASLTATDPSLCEPTSTLIVLDRSSSMRGSAGDGWSKWEAAQFALDRMLLDYDSAVAFGLMTFPYPDSCGPGHLEVPPVPGQRGAIGEVLSHPPPDSGNWTPLGETLLVAADPTQLGGYDLDYVLVITDGFQWCAPYDPSQRALPLEAVQRLRDRGVRTFVVGFGAMVDEVALSQMAVIGGTAATDCDASGQDLARRCYYHADNPPELTRLLMEIGARASTELCDGRDNDCDGLVDDGATCRSGAQCVDGACVATPDDEEPAVPEPDDGDPAGGCGCATGARPDGAALASAVGLALYRRRRRRGTASAPSARSARPADDGAAP